MSVDVVEMTDVVETDTLLDEEACWQAVVDRDAASDGKFVYAVRSTGVFCRPSCPSRRARRENVEFYALPEAAESAGYRACLRCHSDETEVRDPQLATVQRICRHIERSLEGDRPATLEELGDEFALSPYHLQRVFKRVMGITPRQYAEARRLQRLKSGLRDGDTVTGALYDAGYNSSSRLYEKAYEHLGMTPSEYRRGGPQLTIAYTISGCPLGRLLVAATERGVCVVRMGDSDEQLMAQLSKEYHAACLTRDDDLLGEWVEAILRYLGGEQPSLDLPLDVRATAFQWRVWQELRSIPYGSTRSYLQVAQAIDRPGAVRAVANACAANPVALVVPCHRVVREDGSFGGYKWGAERKKALLETEQAHAMHSTSDLQGESA